MANAMKKVAINLISLELEIIHAIEICMSSLVDGSHLSSMHHGKCIISVFCNLIGTMAVADTIPIINFILCIGKHDECNL